jgi:hypothetical protein
MHDLAHDNNALYYWAPPSVFFVCFHFCFWAGVSILLCSRLFYTCDFSASASWVDGITGTYLRDGILKLFLCINYITEKSISHVMEVLIIASGLKLWLIKY